MFSLCCSSSSESKCVLSQIFLCWCTLFHIFKCRSISLCPFFLKNPLLLTNLLSFHRIFIIWAISSWFRRGPSTPDPSTPAGAPRVPSRNLFPKDTLMVFHCLNCTASGFTKHFLMFFQVFGQWTGVISLCHTNYLFLPWLCNVINTFYFLTIPAGLVRVLVPGGGVLRLQQHRSPVLVPQGPGLWRLDHRGERGWLLSAL